MVGHGGLAVVKACLFVLGLGSNLGDRLARLQAAAAKLEVSIELELCARSRVIETSAMGGPPQPDFLNAAVAVRTGLAPIALLELVLAIEATLGRVRPDPVRWGPRIIDIDVLWAQGLALDEPRLALPHPRLRDRPFAVQPLLELVPDACDPLTGERYALLPAAQAPVRLVAARL